MVVIRTPSVDEVRIRNKLELLQSKLGYQFGKNVHLLRREIEHSSTENKKKREDMVNH